MQKNVSENNPVPAVSGELRRLTRYVATVACAGWAALLLFCFVFARGGATLVQGMDRQLGDIVMAEGLRHEEAKQNDEAVASYRRALENRFTNPENRAETLMRLGNLLLWRDGPEAGLPYLEEARAQGCFTVWLYEPLCQALLGAGRGEEALAEAQSWVDVAEQAGNEGRAESAKRFLVNANLKLAEEAEQARDKAKAEECYRRALEVAPPNAERRTELLVRLGILLLSEKGAKEALPFLDEARAGGNLLPWAYEPYCTALIEVGRAKDALACLDAFPKDASDREMAKRVAEMRRRIVESRGAGKNE